MGWKRTVGNYTLEIFALQIELDLGEPVACVFRLELVHLQES